MCTKKNILVLLMLILVSCKTKEEAPIALSTQISLPIPTSTQIESMATKTISITPTRNAEGITNFKRLLAFYKEECQAPCFLLVTPDITSLEESEKILAGDLNYSCTKDAPQGLPTDIYMRCSLYNGVLIVSSNPQTRVVNWLAYLPSLNQPVYLGDIVDIYGIPDGMYINALPDDTGLSMVSLYYDAQQMVIYLEDVNEIVKSSEVTIGFMGKSEYLEERTLAQQSWEGYKKLR